MSIEALVRLTIGDKSGDLTFPVTVVKVMFSVTASNFRQQIPGRQIARIKGTKFGTPVVRAFLYRLISIGLLR